MERISLPNRYRDEVYLEHITDNRWELHCSDYYRIIYDDDYTTINAIDPAGGPFLAVDTKIQNKKITGILPGKILILEDDKTDN